MSVSKSFEQALSSIEARKRLTRVSMMDLSRNLLTRTQVCGHWPSKMLACLDTWAAAKLDGALYGDFCTDVENIPEDARFMALRKLLGGNVAETPERYSLQEASKEKPDTLLVAMWGQDADGEVFLTLFHHPRFSGEDAKRWLIALLGRGYLRSGSES